MKLKKAGSFAVLLLVVGIFLTGCGETLRETEGVVKSKDGSKTFQHASTTYEAVETGKKIGKLTYTGDASEEVYEIEGLSPDEWLVTEDGYVLYADGVHLPSLAEMNPQTVQICAYRQSVHVLRTVSNAEILSDAVHAYTEGENLEYWGQEPLRSYKLRFVSNEYPALYFSVLYLEYGEDLVLDDVNYGRYFLRGIFDSRFVKVGDGMHRLMFGDDATETEKGE